ncbi:Metacaspase-1 protein [Spatholobus suberectus]|nr:Metacaspase-1 protein [Spatholobus suberectus]
MATRRARCTQCGRPMLVPMEAYTIPIMCFGCPAPERTNYPFVNNAPPFVNYPSHADRTRNQFHYPQAQSLPQRAPLPPSAYGNKRAVIVGISYGNQINRLKGSLNDAQCMKYFLIHKLGFPSDSIRMLTDDPEEKNPLRIPTKHNMRMAMRWLVEGCRLGDSLVFHFSGHGSQEVDTNMDEIDGYDEAICPVDYEYEGKILDDEINAIIVRPLPRGAKLHALVDTCFSGTILDLPFMCRMNRKGYYGWEDHRHPRAGYKGTRGGLAVCISACDDDGNAADTSAFGSEESAGALTFSFIQAMQDEPNLTYGRLLNSMRSTIRGAKEKTFGLNDQELTMNTRQQYAHEPQLSSSEKFDIYSKSIINDHVYVSPAIVQQHLTSNG